VLLPSLLARLRHGIGTVEKEHRDLLVRLLTDVDAAVNAVGRLIPVDLARRDLEPLALAYSMARASPCSTTVIR
jgi:hypothetical protein